jgi:subtilase family serine protease
VRQIASHILGAGAVFVAVLGIAGGALTALTARSAAATPPAKRVGSTPRLPHGAQVTGRLRSGRSLSLVVALKPSDPSALAAYATAVSTPGSADYKQYLSVAQFRRRFAPSNSQIQAVRSDLRSSGLAPGSVSANGLLIDVTASASQAAQAFHTGFSQVKLASGRAAYVNTAAPQFSGNVANLVQGVVGLSNLSVPHALGLKWATGNTRSRVPAAPRASAMSAHTSASAPCGSATTAVSDLETEYGIDVYTADQIASAYGFTSLYNAGDFGAGQAVALIEFAPYNADDIAAYQSCYRTSASVTPISVDGGAGTDTSGDGTGEADLDIEQIVGLAPAASIDVYEGPDSDTANITSANVLDAYGEAIDSTAKVISTSWGACETGEETLAQAENTLFEQAAAQGQSVYAAAGDGGSTDCYVDGGKKDRTLAVDDPGSQPYVTSVGGTSLPSISNLPMQTTWNDSSDEDGAGGGGVSALWGMPSYQSGAAASLGVINSYSSDTSCGAASGSYCREVPDVSADADPKTGYLIYTIQNPDSAETPEYGWTAIGGTSAAAPLWAALTALANASSYCDGTYVGFANPVLYDVANSEYSTAFTDISSGTNDYTPSGLTGGVYYRATSGYDMATGLGTPLAGTLVPDVCTIVHPATVTPTNPGSTCKAATNALRKSADKLALRNHDRSAKLTLAATVASDCASDKLSFQIHVATTEPKRTRAKDTLKVRILSISGKTLLTLKTLSDHDAARGYKTVTLNAHKWAGRKVKVRFLAAEGGHRSTSFTIREVKLAAS